VTSFFLKSHYLCLLGVTLLLPYSIFNKNLSDPDYIWLLSTLRNSTDPYWLGLFLFVTFFIVLVVNIIYQKRFLRVLAFLLLVLTLSLVYSFGKINHFYHIWIYSSFFIIFIDDQQALLSAKNLIFCRLSQTALLLQYFSAGLWKLRSYGISLISIKEVEAIVMEHIAHGVIESSLPMNSIRSFLVYDEPKLLTFGFLSVLTFQCVCGLGAFAQRGFLVLGVGAFFFHFSSGLTLGIWYFATAIASAFYLIFLESLLKDPLVNDKGRVL
jgi:hypothetical protein